MVEANPTKFYFAKYFFLAFSLIHWTVMTTLLVQSPFSARNFFIALIFMTLALICLFIFMVISDKVKRVAVGKNKIVVMEGDRNMRFEWPEVKSLRIVPWFNMYCLKIKGKKGSIYFFPSRNIDPAFGGLLAKDNSKMGEIVQKRKKEFNIR